MQTSIITGEINKVKMLTANLITKSQNIVKAKGNEDSKNILKKNRSSLQKVKTTEKIFKTSSLIPRE